jgi:glycosyltransferase involved in cell wall biosynthesis
MKFSLILASRERIPLLKGLLESLVKTTRSIDQIEVLAVFDDDDYLSKSEISVLEETYKFFKSFSRPRSEWMHKDYINWIIPKSTGRYCIVLNDDTQFVNPFWDELAWNKLEEYLSDKPDGIVYGFTDTFTKDSTLCCFPLISRKAIDSVGFMLPNERKNWAADRDVFNLYTHPLVNRKLDLPEVKIKHISYHSGARQRDAISFRIGEIFNKESYIDIPIKNYADCLARTMSNMSDNKNKVLVVYNICGISKKENYSYYLSALNSILYQKFDGFSVVISGCLTSEKVKKILFDNLGNRVSYNWIDERLPLSVTFNHTVQKCVNEFGAFESYLYVDSGVNFANNRNVISKMYDRMNSGPYAMVATQVDVDGGYDYWGIYIKNEDYIVPVGKAVNLHCQLFSHEIFDKYNKKILPDIFANHTSESVYTFINAAIHKKWMIAHDLKLVHESNMDGASSGFLLNSSGVHHFKPDLLFKCPKTITQICSEGQKYGFGYEEYLRVCVHHSAKFDLDGYAKDDNLYEFLKNNVYLSKESLDYDKIQHRFIRSITPKSIDLPSPKLTCIIVSHNKPQYVREAIQSVIDQSFQDWQAIVIDSGVLYEQGFFDYLDDDRIQIIPSNETEQMRKAKAMAPWCFNECFRRGLVKGFLVSYLCDDDILYNNAFEVFVNFVEQNPQVKALYASEDYAVIVANGEVIPIGERRATPRREIFDCQVDYLQFCHTREALNLLPNRLEYWPEGKLNEHHADGVFMDSINKIVPIYSVDIKIGQNRRTSISINDPSHKYTS